MTESAFANGGFDYARFVDEGFDAQSKYAEKVGEHWTPNELKRVDELVELAGSPKMAMVPGAYKARYAKIIESVLRDARNAAPSWKPSVVEKSLSLPTKRKKSSGAVGSRAGARARLSHFSANVLLLLEP